MKLLFVNSKENYQGKVQKAREACAAKGMHVDLWSNPETKDVVRYAHRNGYCGLIHRNEHGRLFADSSIQWVKEAVDCRFPVLSMDFGYLDHYNTVSFDFYRKDLSSGIHFEWDALPSLVQWSKQPRYIRKFRSHCFEKISCADGSCYAGKVGVWMQWNTNLLRPELSAPMPQWQWINTVSRKIKDLGLEPVVKLGPVDHSEIYERTIPNVEPWIRLVCDKPKVSEHNNRAHYDPEANWKLLAGCSYHVILCSSVSHLMVLTQRPVIATGQSWFNRLGVFQEPVEWLSPFTKPVVNTDARGKWLNWWLRKQAPWSETSTKLRETLLAAQTYFSSEQSA